MKSISTLFPPGGSSSASSPGTRIVRDPASSRSSPKRFRPGGPAPLRKKSFRHHLDQTLGKESVPPVLPSVAGPSPSSVKTSRTIPVKSSGRKALPDAPATGPLSSRPLDISKKPVPPASPGRIAVASVSEGAVRNPETIQKDVRPDRGPDLRPSPEETPSFLSAGLPGEHPPPRREGLGDVSGETFVTAPKQARPKPKEAPLLSKEAPVSKKEANTEISIAAPFLSPGPDRKEPGDSFSSGLGEKKEDSSDRDPSPEELATPRPAFSGISSGMIREKTDVPAGKRPVEPSREEAFPPGPIAAAASPASAPESPEVLKKTAEVPDFSRQVMETVRQGGGELTLRVHPPALGPVQVHVHLESIGKTVSLSIRVRDESVRKALVSAGKTLRDRLEREGFSLGRMDVSTLVPSVPSAPSVPPSSDSSPAFLTPSFQTDPGGAQTSFSGREPGGGERPDFPDAKDHSVSANAHPEIGRGRSLLEEAGYHRIA